MTQIKAQADRDAVDAHQGWEVMNPYDPFTQEAQYNEWCIAFNRKKLELEGMEK